jgi:hypothetical protein
MAAPYQSPSVRDASIDAIVEILARAIARKEAADARIAAETSAPGTGNMSSLGREDGRDVARRQRPGQRSG